ALLALVGHVDVVARKAKEQRQAVGGVLVVVDDEYAKAAGLEESAPCWGDGVVVFRGRVLEVGGVHWALSLSSLRGGQRTSFAAGTPGASFFLIIGRREKACAPAAF